MKTLHIFGENQSTHTFLAEFGFVLWTDGFHRSMLGFDMLKQCVEMCMADFSSKRKTRKHRAHQTRHLLNSFESIQILERLHYPINLDLRLSVWLHSAQGGRRINLDLSASRNTPSISNLWHIIFKGCGESPLSKSVQNLLLMCAPGNVNARKASVGPAGPSIAKGKALQGRDNARRILFLSKLLNELN